MRKLTVDATLSLTFDLEVADDASEAIVNEAATNAIEVARVRAWDALEASLGQRGLDLSGVCFTVLDDADNEVTEGDL